MVEKGNQSGSGFARIEPVRVDLAAPESTSRKGPSLRVPGQAWAWAGIAVLLLLAGAVFFVLPNWIEPPTIEPVAVRSAPEDGRGATAPQAPASSPASSGAAGAPWEQAQEAQLRRESQQILEQMLQARKLLSESGVTVWAPDEFERALAFATAGDERYNARDFGAAREQYRQGLALLEELQERVDPVFEDAMARGEQALADGDAEAARAAFDLALAIDPLDRAASDGRQRADTLDQVLALVRQGDRHLQQGQLQEAGDAYRQALDLDPAFEPASRQLAVIEQRSKQRRFDSLMSAGFTALYDGRADEAAKQFRAALKLEPGAAGARDALSQAEHALRERSLAGLVEQARALEAEERWQEALDRYTEALDIDPALQAAQAGRERSAVRAGIHDRLEGILAQPQRLYDADVLAEAEAFYRTVTALRDPGPRLAGQIERLGGLLENMREPVTVQLRSDNATRVTLYRVGELGTFTAQDVTLRPGHYVAVGVREGYRDVRVEFTVEPDRPVPVIHISADDAIAFGSEA